MARERPWFCLNWFRNLFNFVSTRLEGCYRLYVGMGITVMQETVSRGFSPWRSKMTIVHVKKQILKSPKQNGVDPWATVYLIPPPNLFGFSADIFIFWGHAFCMWAAEVLAFQRIREQVWERRSRPVNHPGLWRRTFLLCCYRCSQRFLICCFSYLQSSQIDCAYGFTPHWK